MRITKSKTIYIVHTNDTNVWRKCHNFKDARRWIHRMVARGFGGVGVSRHFFGRGNYQVRRDLKL